MSGKFIVFEGPDGSGKTTQTKLLKEHLATKNFSVLTTREPGGTKISEEIRAILLDVKNREMVPRTEAFLYASARAQHVEEFIKPAMGSGKIVICDRFVDSSMAYQGYGRNLDINFLYQINKLATGGLRPDLTFLIDVEPKEGRDRIRSTRECGEDRIEQEKLEFHQKVRRGYLEIAKKEPLRYIIIDGSLSIKEINDIIVSEVERIL